MTKTNIVDSFFNKIKNNKIISTIIIISCILIAFVQLYDSIFKIIEIFPVDKIIEDGTHKDPPLIKSLDIQNPNRSNGKFQGGLLGKKYDIAISFAGEDRAIANKIASKLDSEGVSVFYDDFEKADLWGKNLYEHLISVYKDRSKYCLMILSANYAKKSWTSHERKAAQARAFRENQEYILPLKLDDAEIDGILETTGFIDYRNETPDSVTKLILTKLWGDLENDKVLNKFKKKLEELYMRMMLTCELAFMPSTHPDYKNNVFTPSLYNSSVDMFNKFKSDLQILSKEMDPLILYQITDVSNAIENILLRVHFLLLLNDPNKKDYYFISEIPESDFRLVYKFLNRIKIFENYEVESKRHFKPDEIIESWKKAEQETVRFSSDLKNFKPVDGCTTFVFNNTTLRNLSGSHLKDGDKVQLFRNLN